MSKRYTIAGNWTTVEDTAHHNYDGGETRVRTELSDVTDTKTGHTYRDGARRVTVKTTGNFACSKTFIGELAYTDARRWTNDVLWTVTR